MIIGPGDAACKARAQMLAQLLNGQHAVHVDLQWTAHQIGQRGRQTQAVMTAKDNRVNRLATVGS